MKKISLVLALCLIFASFPMVVNAATPSKIVIDGIQYSRRSYSRDKNYSVSGFTDDIPEFAVIRSNIDGIPVDDIQTNALYKCPAKAIFIPDSIVTVASWIIANNSIDDIYCEATSQPSGWNKQWIAFWENPEVHWGASLSDIPGYGSNGSTESVLGDINANGSIDSMDYVLLKRAYFGTYSIDDISIGDLNGNSELDAMDYVYLKRAYFGTYDLTK